MITERREFDANLEALDGLLEFIAALTQDFSGKVSYNITLVCEEIFVNVTKYAYPDGAGRLAIVWENDRENRKLRIEFEDSGIPFNPLLKEPPRLDVPISQRQIGGLGIVIVRELMDSVHYDYVDGKNRLTVTKEY